MSSSNSIRAGVADNALVVSFLSAETPRVWRADMSQFQTATLEIQEGQGKFSVVLKRNNAPAEEIGAFSDKKSAASALRLITEALLHGKNAGKSGGWFKKLLKFVLALFVIFVVFTLVVGGGIHHRAGKNDVLKTPPVQMGVPAPADDVIGK